MMSSTIYAPTHFHLCRNFASFRLVHAQAGAILDWRMERHGFNRTTASFVLNSDRTFKIVFGNIVADGSMFGGKTEWRADMSRDPMTLDFVMTSAAGSQRVLPVIFRFITDQKIQMRISEDIQSRPTSFSSDDTRNQLVLVKQ
jgi:hypothetical protein